MQPSVEKLLRRKCQNTQRGLSRNSKCFTFLDLNREDIDSEFDKMKYNYLNLVSYKYNKSEIDEVYPKAESDIRGSFDFSGILKGDKAEITVNLGFGNIITETRKIFISADTNSNNISKIWAEKKIENLSGNYDKNKKSVLNVDFGKMKIYQQK